jgi:phosphoglycolate phosphatase-like HAD superfamily hydrolase
MRDLMKLCLFDIDGTLINTNGSGRVALTCAFESVFGIPGGLDEVRMDGKTDYLIMREAIDWHGLDASSQAVDRVLKEYLPLLEKELARRADAYRVFPGVFELLELLKESPNIILGLATGNIERGARAKLKPGGLNAYFGLGGFGCDAENKKLLKGPGVSVVI